MADPTLQYALMFFRYREEATRRKIPCDPNWVGVIRESRSAALGGERGKTDQQQCVYQAIRLATWESGLIQKPWSKAFLPKLPPQPSPKTLLPKLPPEPWYRQWWNKVVERGKRLWKRVNDLL